MPAALTGTTLTLDGQTLEIHGLVQGDAADNSYVWIPSIKTIVAGDTVYHGVHPWTAETNAAARAAWLGTLDELDALHATTVVAGPAPRTTPPASPRRAPTCRPSTPRSPPPSPPTSSSRR